MSNNNCNNWLIIIPRNGLCNRLRAIASASLLARETNRNFGMVWYETKEIGFAKWNDLFETKFRRMFNINFKTKIISDFKKESQVYMRGGQGGEQRILKDIQNESSLVVVLEAGGNFIPSNISIQKYNQYKSEFYSKLIPIQSIQENINIFWNNNFESSDHVIGVHIRRKDRSRVTPSNMTFATKMKSFLNDNSDVKFLLCTDDKKEEDYFKKVFKDIIIYRKKNNYNRNSAQSTQEALIDWYLLGKCERLFYSFGSSFGYEACIMNRLSNSVEIQDKRWNKMTESHKRNHVSLIF